MQGAQFDAGARAPASVDCHAAPFGAEQNTGASTAGRKSAKAFNYGRQTADLGRFPAARASSPVFLLPLSLETRACPMSVREPFGNESVGGRRQRGLLEQTLPKAPKVLRGQRPMSPTERCGEVHTLHFVSGCPPVVTFGVGLFALRGRGDNTKSHPTAGAATATALVRL